ncbi:hypothetical protein ACA910_015836 [Epithemia clementina (nom. ined.)]
MSFRNSAAYAVTTADTTRPGIALVTGGRSGIGLAIAQKIASFAFIEQVLCVSRSITPDHVQAFPKLIALAADVTTPQGRAAIVHRVQELCGDGSGGKQLRFLIQAAGSIDPIKPVLQVEPEELRRAMVINCEAPLFLTTALYPYMKPLHNDSDNGDNNNNNRNDTICAVAGRVLHVSSGAAHGAPPVGWSCYGISKAAFFQSFKALEREFRHLGGHVVVGSFKPGVVDTNMQGMIRDANPESMPMVQTFRNLKANAKESLSSPALGGDSAPKTARPPPKGALDTPDNVAFFAEYLLLGTTDEEFANANDDNEHSIQDASKFELWIDPSNLP